MARERNESFIFECHKIKEKFDILDTCNILILTWMQMFDDFGLAKVAFAFKKHKDDLSRDELVMMSVLNTQYQTIKMFISKLTENHDLPINVFGVDLKVLTAILKTIITLQHEKLEEESKRFQQEFADVFEEHNNQGKSFMDEIDSILGDW